MKEVKYVVIPSMLFPEKVIYAGTIIKMRGKLNEWRTRCDVTEQVIQAFLSHYVAKTKEENPKGKGIEWSFKPNDDGYKVTIKVEKQRGVGVSE